MAHNIELAGGGGGGGPTFVEIQGFCGICRKTFETDCSYQCSENVNVEGNKGNQAFKLYTDL